MRRIEEREGERKDEELNMYYVVGSLLLSSPCRFGGAPPNLGKIQFSAV
jgi:hypothetical protein